MGGDVQSTTDVVECGGMHGFQLANVACAGTCKGASCGSACPHFREAAARSPALETRTSCKWVSGSPQLPSSAVRRGLSRGTFVIWSADQGA